MKNAVYVHSTIMAKIQTLVEYNVIILQTVQDVVFKHALIINVSSSHYVAYFIKVGQ